MRNNTTPLFIDLKVALVLIAVVASFGLPCFSTASSYRNLWQNYILWDIRSCDKLNAFTTRNPFSGTNLLGFSMGRGFRALKGLSSVTLLHLPEK